YWIYILIKCIFKKKLKIFNNKKFIFNNTDLEILFTFLVFSIGGIGFLCVKTLINAGAPLEKYNDFGHELTNGYTPIAHEHLITIIIFFILGIVSYLLIKIISKKLPPIPYIICCSILIINIIFSIIFILHTNITLDFDFGLTKVAISSLRYVFFLLSLML
ncbi:DUF6688 domain-containing protein, partial [Clostridium tarantellae]|uniref:DUF6688 domain-containing protein n=1 Tax=Clostridium tarantellae TaxID=39493 RepID=UPI0014781160